MKNRNVDDKTRGLADGLTGLLADTFVLQHSTLASHWNVEGPQFHSLHAMFETQYRDLADAIDLIAERARSLGFYVPATLASLLKRARIRQPEGIREPSEMLAHLIEGHEQVIHRAGELRGAAEDAMDEATADLLVERLRRHEKMLWMLRSQAGQESVELAPVETIRRAG